MPILRPVHRRRPPLRAPLARVRFKVSCLTRTLLLLTTMLTATSQANFRKGPKRRSRVGERVTNLLFPSEQTLFTNVT